MNPVTAPLIIASSDTILNSLSPATLSSYWSAWKCFRQFHLQYNITFPSFDLVTLTSFITHAHSALDIKIHTIKGYLCGISFFAKLLTGCPGLTTNHPQISLLMRGLLSQEPAQTPRRLPLTADLLSICIHTIRSGYGVPHIARTLEAMFLLAFRIPQMLRIHSIHASLRPKPSCLHFRPLPVFRRHLGLPLKTNQNKCIRQADTCLLLQVPIASESF